jgi:hypothetical protein
MTTSASTPSVGSLGDGALTSNPALARQLLQAAALRTVKSMNIEAFRSTAAQLGADVTGTLLQLGEYGWTLLRAETIEDDTIPVVQAFADRLANLPVHGHAAGSTPAVSLVAITDTGDDFAEEFDLPEMLPTRPTLGTDDIGFAGYVPCRCNGEGCHRCGGRGEVPGEIVCTVLTPTGMHCLWLNPDELTPLPSACRRHTDCTGWRAAAFVDILQLLTTSGVTRAGWLPVAGVTSGWDVLDSNVLLGCGGAPTAVRIAAAVRGLLAERHPDPDLADIDDPHPGVRVDAHGNAVSFTVQLVERRDPDALACELAARAGDGVAVFARPAGRSLGEPGWEVLIWDGASERIVGEAWELDEALHAAAINL